LGGDGVPPHRNGPAIDGASQHSFHHHGRCRHRSIADVRIRRRDAAGHAEHHSDRRCRNPIPQHLVDARMLDEPRGVVRGTLPDAHQRLRCARPQRSRELHGRPIRDDRAEAAEGARLSERAVREVPPRRPDEQSLRERHAEFRGIRSLRRFSGSSNSPRFKPRKSSSATARFPPVRTSSSAISRTDGLRRIFSKSKAIRIRSCAPTTTAAGRWGWRCSSMSRKSRTRRSST